jgi:hypothetical protein
MDVLILLNQCNEALQLNEKNEEHIFELEGHDHNYADEIATLTQSLEEDQDLMIRILAYKDDLRHVILSIR